MISECVYCNCYWDTEYGGPKPGERDGFGHVVTEGDSPKGPPEEVTTMGLALQVHNARLGRKKEERL